MALLRDPARLERARRYRVFRLRLALASQTVGVVAMVALYASGASLALRDTLANPWTPLGTFLVVSALLAASGLAGFPLAYVGYRRGRHEGLIVQNVGSWFVDRLKSFLVIVVLFGLPLSAWYAVLGRDVWWLATIAGSIVVAIVVAALGPFLQALFFRFTPLEDVGVVDRIRRLGERSGVRVAAVFRWGMSEKLRVGNAAVVGLGPTKRIVIADTLLGAYPLDEIEAVVAHELGHQVHADVMRYFLVLSLGVSASLIAARLIVDRVAVGGSVGGAADVGSFPLLVATLGVLRFLIQPAFLAYSRRRERAADDFGARLASPRAMASALVRLADQNLSDPEPPAWEEAFFMSHPSTRSRVRSLRQPWPFALPRPATG